MGFSNEVSGSEGGDEIGTVVAGIIIGNPFPKKHGFAENTEFGTGKFLFHGKGLEINIAGSRSGRIVE